MEKGKDKVLITGITGFLGSWVLKKFLDDGKFDVRGTVRDPNNKDKLQPLKDSIGDRFDDVELVSADLTDSDSLEKAIEGCQIVVHTASPFPDSEPSNEDELIIPAVEGTKAVLHGCHTHKVRRLVVTSSTAAIIDYNNFKEDNDESDWLDINHPKCPIYPKSKALAEMTVWDYVDSLPEDEKFEVVTINPSFIIGPLLIKSQCTSANIISKLMTGGYPGLPHVFMGVVDVRDVADAHLIAATTAPPNERYIVAEGTYEMSDVADILNDEFSQYGYSLVRRKFNYCIVWMLSPFISEVALIIDQWGKNAQLSNEKAKTMLGMKFTDPKITLKDMGYSLIKQGYIDDLTQQ